FLLMLARHLGPLRDTFRQGGGAPITGAGDFVAMYNRFTGVELGGRTVGVVALGAVGREVAARLVAFKARVLAYDPYVTDPPPERDRGGRHRAPPARRAPALGREPGRARAAGLTRVPDVLVTLDAGTGSGRSVAFDLAGRPLASAQEPFRYTLFSDPSLPFLRGFDLDPEAFWGALARSARAVVARLPAGARILGVAATSQRE